MFRHVKIGASINSPVSHCGIAFVPGQGAFDRGKAGDSPSAPGDS
jgi:hypothetical protein